MHVCMYLITFYMFVTLKPNIYNILQPSIISMYVYMFAFVCMYVKAYQFECSGRRGRICPGTHLHTPRAHSYRVNRKQL